MRWLGDLGENSLSGSPLARAFENAASDYEHGRPEWPIAAVNSLGLPPSAAVLDLAAGTGKLTRLLVRRFTRVIAVEPSDAMRRVLDSVVPSAEALEGTAEAIPLGDASVDAVFVADAFHWFGTSQVVAEIARVLRQGGVLALLWFHAVRVTEPSTPDAFKRRVEQLRASAPEHPYLQGTWRRAFEAGRFGPLHEEHFDFSHFADREGMVAYAASSSWIAAKSNAERAAIRDEFRQLLPDTTYRTLLDVELRWTRLES